MRSATAASTTPSTATPQKVGAIPITSASVPIAGPTIVPATAAPIVVPISSPRRSRGAAPATQASAPAHEAAPPMPWTKRARTRSSAEFANANITQVTTSRPMPSSTVARTPAFAAR